MVLERQSQRNLIEQRSALSPSVGTGFWHVLQLQNILHSIEGQKKAITADGFLAKLQP